MSDACDVHFDDNGIAWSVADDAEEILSAALDSERPVELEDDYAYDEVAR